MKNPMYKVMLEAFINHLERRGSRSGWQIISKGSYDNKTNYNKSSSTRSSKTQRKVMRLFWEWYEMGEDDKQYEIDMFLKTWNEQE